MKAKGKLRDPLRKPRNDSAINRLVAGNDALRDEIISRSGKEPADATRAWLLKAHGLRICESSLYYWLREQRVRLMVEGTTQSARAFKEFLSVYNPGLTPADVERVADLKFAMDTAAQDSPKDYAQIAGIILRRRALEQEEIAHKDKMVLAEKQLILSREQLQLRVRQLEGDLNRARSAAGKIGKKLGEKLDPAAITAIRAAVMKIALGPRAAKKTS